MTQDKTETYSSHRPARNATDTTRGVLTVRSGAVPADVTERPPPPRAWRVLRAKNRLTEKGLRMHTLACRRGYRTKWSRASSGCAQGRNDPHV